MLGLANVSRNAGGRVEAQVVEDGEVEDQERQKGAGQAEQQPAGRAQRACLCVLQCVCHGQEHNLVIFAASSRLRCGACHNDHPRTLLEAALRLLEERGPGRCACATCRGVGKSTMGVYTHFGSSRGCSKELYLHGFQTSRRPARGRPRRGNGAGAPGVRPGLPRIRPRQRRALRVDVRARAPGLHPLRRQPAGGLKTFEMLVHRIAAGGQNSPTPRATHTSSGRRCTAWSPSSSCTRRWAARSSPTSKAIRAELATAVDSLVAGLARARTRSPRPS